MARIFTLITAMFFCAALIATAHADCNWMAHDGGFTAGAAELQYAAHHNAEHSASPADSDEAAAESKEDIAVEAYEPTDATPTENWFGCPPGTRHKEGGGEQDCEPVEPETE